MKTLIYAVLLALSIHTPGFALDSSYPTEAKLTALITDINAALADGTLAATGPGKSGQGRVKAFVNKLGAALNAAQSSGNQDASTQLASALSFAAGDASTEPLFTGSASAVLLGRLTSVVNYMNGETEIAGSWLITDPASQQQNYIVFNELGVVEDYSTFRFESGAYELGANQFTSAIYHGQTSTSLSCVLDTEDTGVCNNGLTLKRVANTSACTGFWLGRLNSYSETQLSAAARFVAVGVEANGLIAYTYGADYSDASGRMLCDNDTAILFARPTESQMFEEFKAEGGYDAEQVTTLRELAPVAVLTRQPYISFDEFTRLPGYADYVVIDPDTDGDGIPDSIDPDDDNDGRQDRLDNCPLVPNRRQTDRNRNGIGDVCE